MQVTDLRWAVRLAVTARRSLRFTGSATRMFLTQMSNQFCLASTLYIYSSYLAGTPPKRVDSIERPVSLALRHDLRVIKLMRAVTIVVTEI